MWCGTLQGNDIQRARAELEVQRSAIQAHYDNEMKRLETKIAGLETFERSIVDFVSNYGVEDGSLTTVADPGPVAEEVTDEIGSEEARSTSSETPVERPKITLPDSSDSGVPGVHGEWVAEWVESGQRKRAEH